MHCREHHPRWGRGFDQGGRLASRKDVGPCPMSYVYLMLQLRHPVASMKELRQEDMLPLSLDTARRVLDAQLPAAKWTDQMTLSASNLGYGRLDFCLQSDPVPMVRVDGSHHTDQTALLRRVATALNCCLVDAQSGDAYCEQVFSTAKQGISVQRRMSQSDPRAYPWIDGLCASV